MKALENPGAVLELVAGVQLAVVRGARLPHLPDDLEPAMTAGAQCYGVAFAAFTELLVIDLGPGDRRMNNFEMRTRSRRTQRDGATEGTDLHGLART